MSNHTRKVKELEYEESPSGAVTMYNYKEPFMDFYDEVTGGGYGYQGVLMFDAVSERCQCHFCGDWVHYLPKHLHKEHNMTAEDYKKRVGLRKNSALISENTRKLMVKSGRERFDNIVAHTQKHTEESKGKISQTLKENARQRESENEKGVCPAQLVDRYLKLYEKNGFKHLSHKKIPFKDTAKVVYGSWDNFMEACGFYERVGWKNQNDKYTSLVTYDAVVSSLREFYSETGERIKAKKGKIVFEHGKGHLRKKLNRLLFSKTNLAIEGMMKASKKRGWNVNNIILESRCGVVSPKRKWTKEKVKQELLDFKERHNEIPSLSDAKRGLLPRPSLYYYYFKSFREALIETFGKDYLKN